MINEHALGHIVDISEGGVATIKATLHSMGNKDFIEKWHLEPVRIDAKIAKIYKLNTKEKG